MNYPAPPGKVYQPFQLKGIRYMLGSRGSINGDEMGLGKTVQAIGVLNAMGKAQGEEALIVCPAGLRHNWKNELAEWRVPSAPRCTVMSYHEAEQLRKSDMPPLGYYQTLIFDEAHYVKNGDTIRSKAIKHLAHGARARVIALTGTPIENNIIELWPLLQIVCPEVWDPPRRVQTNVISPAQRASHPGEGPNFWAFAQRYCNLRMVSRPIGKGRFAKAYDFSGSSNLEELNRRLKETCMVRRLKADVLPELPDKRRQIILLPSKVNDDAMMPGLNEENYYEMLDRLKADKVLFEEFSKKRHAQGLAKVNACCEIIQDALDAGGKLIIFAHHGDVIAKYEAILRDGNPGIGVVVVTGKTHVADRGAAVHRFQNDPACRIFIGSIGAAGVGITLTASSHVIFVEEDPVPGRVSQAEDRAHRITQKNMVLVWHLLLDGSLCARMCKIVLKKQEKITAALDRDYGSYVVEE